MPLETTIICLDNSEWMRNGDYAPSRLEAQLDAATLLCNDKTNANPESTVGVIAMSGKTGVDLMTSPTEDQGKILAAIAKVKISNGKSDFSSALQIAQLALKHRKNTNGGKRIILFVGSPISEAPEELEKVGLFLKKNAVAIDIISIGQLEDNEEKMTNFVNLVDVEGSCRLIKVPPGVPPTDALIASPIMDRQHGFGGGIAGGGGGGGGNFEEYNGVDPSIDPELAMVMRASLEEARAREEARATATAAADSTSVGGGSSSSAAMDLDDEEAALQQALLMSMASTESSAGPPVPSIPQATEEDDDEEAALQRALNLSMEQTAAPDSKEWNDPAFINQLLGNEGLGLNDPGMQDALRQLGIELPAPPAAGDSSADEKSPENKKRKDEDDHK